MYSIAFHRVWSGHLHMAPVQGYLFLCGGDVHIHGNLFPCGWKASCVQRSSLSPVEGTFTYTVFYSYVEGTFTYSIVVHHMWRGHSHMAPMGGSLLCTA